MAINSGADGHEGAVARPDGRDCASIERAFVVCFRNAIVTPSPQMMEELREATRRFAEALRDDGAQPEQALIRLKAFIRDQSERHWTPSLYESEGRISVEARVYQRLFEWWLTAHFARPVSGTPSLTMQAVAVSPRGPSRSLPMWSGQATADAR